MRDVINVTLPKQKFVLSMSSGWTQSNPSAIQLAVSIAGLGQNISEAIVLIVCAGCRAMQPGGTC